MSNALLLASMLACCSKPAEPGPPPPPPPPSWPEAQAQLLDLIQGWLDHGELTRDDGYTYAVDVAQVLLYAAHAGNRALYERLADGVVRSLLVTRPNDDFTRGFVAWRVRSDRPHDATGTTEALRLARALMLGARTLQRPNDGVLARTILEGYARHAQTDRGVWFIANYYNLGSNTLVTNSYLVDYDVDLVSAMASDDASFTDLATRSRALVAGSAAPNGLIYDIVQPEVLTLMPHFTGTAFSPNDVIQVSNSCTVAERAVTTIPEIGRGVLAFTKPRLESLSLAYYGRDGAIAVDDVAGLETLGCLTRLAYKLGDAEAEQRARDQFAIKLAAWLRASERPQPHLYTASEALLTIQCVVSDGKDC